MVKEFLGNIKGNKGDRGDKGDDGGFNGERIGTQNLITLNSFGAHFNSQDNPITGIDIENGIVEFEGVAWYINNSYILNGTNHSLSVKNFNSNADFNQGRLQVIIYESMNGEAGEQLYYFNIHAGDVINIDLSGRNRQLYRFEFRISNSARHTGFIEKPMLVEGEYHVDWFPSYDDLNTLLSQQKPSAHSRFMRSTGVGLGQTEQINLYNYQGNIEREGNDLVLKEGHYIIKHRMAITPHTSGSTSIEILVNGDLVDLNQIPPSLSPRTYNYTSNTYLVRIESNDSLLGIWLNNETDTELDFWISDYNWLEIVKI